MSKAKELTMISKKDFEFEVPEAFSSPLFLDGRSESFLFVDEDGLVGAAELNFRTTAKSLYIANLVSIEPKVGHGTRIIEHLLSLPDVSTIEGEAPKDSIRFFEGLNAEITSYNKEHKTYLFVLYAK